MARLATCINVLTVEFIQCFDFPDVSFLYKNMSDEVYVIGESARLKEMKEIAELLLKECPNVKNLLDIGAGTGLLLQSVFRIRNHWPGSRAIKLFCWHCTK
jgi:hypothetical protein